MKTGREFTTYSDPVRKRAYQEWLKGDCKHLDSFHGLETWHRFKLTKGGSFVSAMLTWATYCEDLGYPQVYDTYIERIANEVKFPGNVLDWKIILGQRHRGTDIPRSVDSRTEYDMTFKICKGDFTIEYYVMDHAERDDRHTINVYHNGNIVHTSCRYRDDDKRPTTKHWQDAIDFIHASESITID